MNSENEGQRRSLNMLFVLGADFSPTRDYAVTVLSRKNPRGGLGGRWERETLTVVAKNEHDARRMILNTYLANDRRVKEIIIL